MRLPVIEAAADTGAATAGGAEPKARPERSLAAGGVVDGIGQLLAPGGRAGKDRESACQIAVLQ
jgi:hypothetical protein